MVRPHRAVSCVMPLLYEAGVALKLNHCKFFFESIEYMRPIIRQGILKLQNTLWIPPWSTTFLLPKRSSAHFQVFAMSSDSFHQTSRVSPPPSIETVKVRTSTWWPLWRKARVQRYSYWQEALFSRLLLALPKRSGLYTLDTDAYDYQIRFVLLQEQKDGSNHLVRYKFWTLNYKKRKLPKMHKECLSAVWDVTSLRLYFEWTHSMI